MNRKDYEAVELEIIRFDAEDVIVTSETVPGGGDGGDEVSPKPGM
jgi:hypothetical protein